MNHKDNRFALRDLTRGDHERLDALVGEFTDVESYMRYLEGMAAFRGGVERELSNIDYPDMFGTWRPAMIHHELAMDLADLGRHPPPLQPFNLPVDLDGLLGVLYVLEGSALGARLLVRRAAAIGFTDGYGARHLAAQTADPQAWSRFVALLDAIAPQGLEKAARAARMTFAAAIEAFGGMRPLERTG